MPKPQFYYDPFGKQMETDESGWNKYDKKDNCFVVSAPLVQIRQMPYNGTLIIDGHSSSGSNTIDRTQFDNRVSEKITSSDLAWMINQCELPKDHCLIRLLACEASFYASMLATELSRVYGYQNIAVGGYREKNFQIAGMRTQFMPRLYDGDGELLGEKPISWYGSGGRLLDSKPVVPQRY